MNTLRVSNNIPFQQSARVRYVPTMLSLILLSLLPLTVARAAVVRTWDGGGAVGDNNWNTVDNWSDDTLPTQADLARIVNPATGNATQVDISSAPAVADGVQLNQGLMRLFNGQSLTLDATPEVTPAGTTNFLIAVGGGSATLEIADAGTILDVLGSRALIVGNGGSGTGTLDQTNGTVTTGATYVGNTNSVVGIYNHSGGSHTTNDLRIGVLSAATSGAYNISNTADLNVNGTIRVSQQSTGLLSIDGSSATIDVDGYLQGALGTLDLTADATGISTINLVGTASLAGNLTVDLSALTSLLDALVIINNDGGDAITGTFDNAPSGTQYLAGNGRTYSLHYNYDATSMSVGGGNDLALLMVPEPTGAAMVLLGALGLIAWCIRRCRK